MRYQPQPLDMDADREYIWERDSSVTFKTNIPETRFICPCGATKNQPYCDGTHVELNKAAAI